MKVLPKMLIVENPLDYFHGIISRSCLLYYEKMHCNPFNLNSAIEQTHKSAEEQSMHKMNSEHHSLQQSQASGEVVICLGLHESHVFQVISIPTPTKTEKLFFRTNVVILFL